MQSQQIKTTRIFKRELRQTSKCREGWNWSKNNQSGRNKLVEGTEAGKARSAAPLTWGTDDGGWLMGQWQPDPLPSGVSICGLPPLTGAADTWLPNRALQGFHPRFWSFSFTDEPTKLTSHRCFVYNWRNSCGLCGDISLSIKRWCLNSDTARSAWSLCLERQFWSVMV